MDNKSKPTEIEDQALTDDTQIMHNDKIYHSSTSLTPAVFKANKNLTSAKLSQVSDYYNKLCSLLPNSCFIPYFDEWKSKEVFSSPHC